MKEKPRLRFDYRKDRWRLDGFPFELCHICGRPNRRKGTCGICQNARYQEMRTQRRIFLNALRSGLIPSLADRLTKCVDCVYHENNLPSQWPDTPVMIEHRKIRIEQQMDVATEWDHRDWREPLKVEPVCRMHNARRGRAMTAFEASFVQLKAAKSTPSDEFYTWQIFTKEPNKSGSVVRHRTYGQRDISYVAVSVSEYDLYQELGEVPALHES